jgi:threonine/homoserine/homoserine lactone efflux protein
MRIAHQRDPKKKPFMLHSLTMSPTFAAFLIASTILAVTPGPGVIYVVTRTLSRGRQAGLASVGGIALGNLANATAASLGLAALLAASATAFAAMKLAGAAYLVFLGVKSLKPKPVVEVPRATDRVSNIRLFADGFFVALLNPKTALFFAALLPQFINPDAPPLAQALVLACVFVAIALCTDTIYVVAAAALAAKITATSAARSVGRYLTAATFIIVRTGIESDLRRRCCSSGSCAPAQAPRPPTRHALPPARNTSAQSWAARSTRRSQRRTASPARARARSSAW